MQGLADEHDNPGGDYRKVHATRRTHCARGAPRCPRCQAAHDEGPVYELVVPDANELQAARQVVRFRDAEDGNSFWSEFRVVQTFASEHEARQYAQEHGITDVDL